MRDLNLIKEYMKEYYLKNKQKLSAQKKEWYIKNKERVKITKNNYYLKNKNRINNLHKYYMRNYLKDINKRKKHNLINSKSAKKYNYKHQKTTKALTIRTIRQKTRNKYPTNNNMCQICGENATEHHHYSRPIAVDNFIFICKKCHVNIERFLVHEKGGVTKNG